MVSSTHEQNSICSPKKLNDIAHEQTIICRQLFAGHVVGSRPMKRKKHLHRMIITINSVHIRSIKKRELVSVYREVFQSIFRKQRPFPFLRNVIPPRSWVADQTPIREIWVYFFKRR